jgi:hypothetical protein
MEAKDLIRKDRILEYLDNIERQIRDLASIPASGKEFFLDRKNSIVSCDLKPETLIIRPETCNLKPETFLEPAT